MGGRVSAQGIVVFTVGADIGKEFFRVKDYQRKAQKKDKHIPFQRTR